MCWGGWCQGKRITTHEAGVEIRRRKLLTGGNRETLKKKIGGGWGWKSYAETCLFPIKILGDTNEKKWD